MTFAPQQIFPRPDSSFSKKEVGGVRIDYYILENGRRFYHPALFCNLCNLCL